MNSNKTIRTVRNVKGNSIIASPVRFKSLSEEPVEVVSSSKFRTGLPRASAVITDNTWDMNIAELIGEHSDTRGELVCPEENRTKHGVFVSLCEFGVDIPTEQVTSEEEDTSRIVQTGEVIIGKKDDLLKELSESLDPDVSVVCVAPLDLVRVDNLVKVSVRKDSTDYASFFGLLLGTKPRGWLDRTAFKISEKTHLIIKNFKLLCQRFNLGFRRFRFSFISRGGS